MSIEPGLTILKFMSRREVFPMARQKNSGCDFSGWPGSCLRGVGQAKNSVARDIEDRHDIRKKDQAPQRIRVQPARLKKAL
ncbi:hypothetical protein Q0601_03590 [Paracoccus onubensis]|uniref:hypothetical protein n=1 Tax=Paracoccus onubensis TaxID=1675788 RepID=UPI002731F01A|nr:hypothetical protein [Paracoccus onubensis]MDP0926248.1 hypothetical protein [Paracoccus onubensis]